jgi:hypothetical protein
MLRESTSQKRAGHFFYASTYFPHFPGQQFVNGQQLVLTPVRDWG